MEPASEKILFVINPVSGGKTKINYEAEIREYFKELLHTIEFFLLDDNNDATRLKPAIEAFKPQKVVAVGGDGTVTMVAKEVIGTDICMGIVPAGSANGMAKELAIPTVLKDVFNIIVNGQIKRADVIKINNHGICLHLSDIGLNAKLIKYFEEGNTRGKIGYAKVALKVLWRRQQISVVISKDKQIKRDAFMVVLANASKYGTGAVINPKGDLYDGLFEVVIIRRLSFFSILKMFFKPKPFNPKYIEVIKAKSVHIVTGHHVHFQMDGEYIGKVKEIKAQIMPAMLNLCLPND